VASIVYLDENHNFVLEEDATWKVIHEYDKEGKLIKEVWVDLKRD
jgi:hypothetical protein